MEMIEDRYLLTLAQERLATGSGETRSFEEVLAKDGLTMEDVET